MYACRYVDMSGIPAFMHLILPLHLLDKDRDFLAMQRILNPMLEAP